MPDFIVTERENFHTRNIYSGFRLIRSIAAAQRESIRLPQHQRTSARFMSAVEWQIAVPSGNSVATYRGIRIVLRLDEIGNPLEIYWFIGGRVAERMPASCDLESAKIIGTSVIDARIPLDERWADAEKRDRDSELWNTQPESPNPPDCP